MGFQLPRMVLLAGWLPLLPISVQAQSAFPFQEVPSSTSPAVPNLAQGATQITSVSRADSKFSKESIPVAAAPLPAAP